MVTPHLDSENEEGDRATYEQSRLVSLVINNYNYERYVGEAIDSALGQDYQHIEVVVVDDGSTDRSRDIIRNYGDRIVTVFQPNGGQGAAYNAGFAACRGGVVIFLDADDRIYPNAVTEIVKRFDVDVSKVQFNMHLIDGEGESLGQSLFNSSPDPGSFLSLLGTFLSYPHPPGSGNAYRRSFLQKRLPVPPDQWRIAADSCLIFAAPLDGMVVHLHDCLGDYRRHGAGASDLASGGLIAYISREHQRLLQARGYTAGLLGSSPVRPRRGNFGFEPTHLKLVMAEVFLCHPEAPSASVRIGFVKEAVRTALGWQPWPLTKRCALPLWVSLVSAFPRRTGARLLAASMMRSFPESHRQNLVEGGRAT